MYLSAGTSSSTSCAVAFNSCRPRLSLSLPGGSEDGATAEAARISSCRLEGRLAGGGIAPPLRIANGEPRFLPSFRPTIFGGSSVRSRGGVPSGERRISGGGETLIFFGGAGAGAGADASSRLVGIWPNCNELPASPVAITSSANAPAWLVVVAHPHAAPPP